MKDKMVAVFDGKRFIMKKRKKGQIEVFCHVGQTIGYTGWLIERAIKKSELKYLPRKKKKKLKKLLLIK